MTNNIFFTLLASHDKITLCEVWHVYSQFAEDVLLVTGRTVPKILTEHPRRLKSSRLHHLACTSATSIHYKPEVSWKNRISLTHRVHTHTHTHTHTHQQTQCTVWVPSDGTWVRGQLAVSLKHHMNASQKCGQFKGPNMPATVSCLFLKTRICVLTEVCHFFPTNASSDLHYHTLYTISHL